MGILSAHAFAESGYIETGGISVMQKSNITLFPFGSNRIISTTSDSGQPQSEVDPYISFEYKNKLNNTLVTISLDEEEKLSLTLNKNSYGVGLFV
jgi:hypothetical protein